MLENEVQKHEIQTDLQANLQDNLQDGLQSTDVLDPLEPEMEVVTTVKQEVHHEDVLHPQEEVTLRTNDELPYLVCMWIHESSKVRRCSTLVISE